MCNGSGVQVSYLCTYDYNSFLFICSLFRSQFKGLVLELFSSSSLSVEIVLHVAK